MHQTLDCASWRRQRGFTLIELMIALVVLGLLSMVAIPTYMDSVRKGRRSEAVAAIAAVQQAQERSRGNFPRYCPNLSSSASSSVCGLGINANTANGRYTLELSNPAPDANSYTVTATAQGAQASDTRCLKMGARASEGQIRYGSGSSSIDWGLADADVNRCWAR